MCGGAGAGAEEVCVLEEGGVEVVVGVGVGVGVGRPVVGLVDEIWLSGRGGIVLALSERTVDTSVLARLRKDWLSSRVLVVTVERVEQGRGAAAAASLPTAAQARRRRAPIDPRPVIRDVGLVVFDLMVLARKRIVRREVGIQLRAGESLQLRVVVVVHSRSLDPQTRLSK